MYVSLTSSRQWCRETSGHQADVRPCLPISTLAFSSFRNKPLSGPSTTLRLAVTPAGSPRPRQENPGERSFGARSRNDGSGDIAIVASGFNFTSTTSACCIWSKPKFAPSNGRAISASFRTCSAPQCRTSLSYALSIAFPQAAHLIC